MAAQVPCVRASDGFIHASLISARVLEYLGSSYAQTYLQWLRDTHELDYQTLVQKISDGPEADQGIFLHPLLGTHFLFWLRPEWAYALCQAVDAVLLEQINR
mgnify:FL=1